MLLLMLVGDACVACAVKLALPVQRRESQQHIEFRVVDKRNRKRIVALYNPINRQRGATSAYSATISN
jgi:hypothetical protein